MNTYLIPTTPPYVYKPYNYICVVYANTSQEAYNIAKNKLSGYCIPQWLSEYECYPTKLYGFPSDIFHESKKYDILNPILFNTKELKHMAYFNVDWNNYTEELSKLAQ